MGKSSRQSKAFRRRPASVEVEKKPAKKEPVAAIPPEVSRRMVRRILVFSGIPSGLGLSSFFVNYYLLTNHVVALPPYFTLAESLALFGLGFLGISYGVFSASWDPEPGSLLGIGEFRRNLSNVIQQWRESAARSSESKDSVPLTRKDSVPLTRKDSVPLTRKDSVPLTRSDSGEGEA